MFFVQPSRLKYLPPFAGLCAVLLAGQPVSSLAVPPVNDQCTGAITIPGAGPFPFYSPLIHIAEATVTGNEVALTNTAAGFCSAPVSRGVWYSFTPTTNAVFTIATCSPGTTVGDTVLGIFTSPSGCGAVGTSFVRIECNDDSCGPGLYQSSITRPLLKDTRYFIVVWQWDTEVPGPGEDMLQLLVTQESPPQNDTCATAQPVFLNTRVSGSTSLASNDYQLAGSACFAGVGQTPVSAAGRDVVFTFTAPDAGTYSIKAYNYSFAVGYNLVLYVTDGCPVGTAPVSVTNCLAAANRNPATTAEEISCLPLGAEQQIWIIVDDAVSTNRGSGFTLEVTRCRWESEPNNSISNASPFECGIEGAMSPPGDSDFFALGNFPAGSRLFALLDGEAANIPEFDLRITSMTDTLEYDDKDNDSLFAQSSPNIAGTPLPAGPVFLRVNYNGAALAEPYRLYATIQPPLAQAAVEIEPNNLTASANSSAGNYFRGALAGPSPSIDADVYSFVADEGDLVFVSLDSDPLRDDTPINAQLELLDAFGNSLVLVNDVNNVSNPDTQPGNLGANVPTSPGEGLVYRCAEGSYFVRVSISPSASGLSANGDYLLSITRNCIPGSTGQNTAPTVDGLAVSTSTEGGTATLSGTIFDPDLGDNLDVTITWGDGSMEQLHSSVAGLLPLSLTHTYADDAPSGTAADNYQVVVTVSDRKGTQGSGMTMALVNNLPPTLGNVSVTTPVSAGANATLTGSIGDAGALDTFYLTVSWGDGSPSQHFNHPAGTSTFNANHAYVTGGSNYTINITLNDDDTGEATASTVVTVNTGGGNAEPARFLGINTDTDGNKVLSLQGTAGALYRIEWSGNLANWFTLTNANAGIGGLIVVKDTQPSPNSRFYRAVAP